MSNSTSGPCDAPIAWACTERILPAIGVSIGAGLATSVGGALVFFPHCFKSMPQQIVLAVALAISGGVMLYVSFIEIFVKSLAAISASDAGFSQGGAVAVTTTCFFCGMLFCALLEVLVDWLSRCGGGTHADVCPAHGFPGGHSHEKQHDCSTADEEAATSTCSDEACGAGSSTGAAAEMEAAAEALRAANANVAHAQQHQLPARMLTSLQKKQQQAQSALEAATEAARCAQAAFKAGAEVAQVKVVVRSHDAMVVAHTHDAAITAADMADAEEKKRLGRMGIMTALAIGIHNFPEGLATFLATVNDARVGASLGVAIAVHNIPEGVCVAMPFYYATGSPTKAFFWSFLSGLTEPIGGIAGFAVLQPVFTDLVFGIVFSMVGGMMVFIVCHELLPAAHRYMGNEAKATGCLILGMMIMAVSLVLFQDWETPASPSL